MIDMKVYVLISCEYDWYEFNNVHGIFSSVEKAVEHVKLSFPEIAVFTEINEERMQYFIREEIHFIIQKCVIDNPMEVF